MNFTPFGRLGGNATFILVDFELGPEDKTMVMVDHPDINIFPSKNLPSNQNSMEKS